MEPIQDARSTRRAFCAGVCQAASGAALATLVSACGGDGSPTGPGGVAASTLPVLTGQVSGSTIQVATAGTALASVGGSARVQSSMGGFLVTRTAQDAFSAVTSTCTHELCLITGHDGAIYVCPCHGSRFTSGGQVVTGPATASLRAFTTSLAGDTLSIAV